MLNNELELELELESLQLESSLLIENGDNEKSKNNIVTKFKAFFAKIFKWIRETISNLKSKVMARFVDIEKAYKKHLVDGNPTLEFKGAEWLGEIDDVTSVLNSTIEEISTSNSHKYLDDRDKYLRNVSKIVINSDLMNKVGKIDVDTLGVAIKKFNGILKDLDEATKIYKKVGKEAKSALKDLEKGSAEEDIVLLAKKKATILKRVLSLHQSEISRSSYVIILGINEMKKVGKARASKDTPNNTEPKTESSFLEDSINIESELDKLLQEDNDFEFGFLNEDFQDEEDIDRILDSLVEF